MYNTALDIHRKTEFFKIQLPVHWLGFRRLDPSVACSNPDPNHGERERVRA